MSGKIEEILDEIENLAAAKDEVSVGDVMDRIGHRGSGAFLLIPSLLGITPLGAVPTVPTILAVIVVVLAAQIVLGRERMWLPGVLRHRSADRDKLAKATEWLRRPAGALDRWFGGRLPWAAGRAAQRLAGVVCIALALVVSPLELVPFGAAIPLAVIAAFGLALTLKDGLLMLLAFAGSAAAFYGVWMLI